MPRRSSLAPSRHAVLLGALLLGLGGNGATAGNLTVETTLDQSAKVDTNPLLQRHGEQTIFGSVTHPSVALTDETPLTSLKLNGALTENLYNRSAYNSTDVTAKANLARRNQRWEVSVAGNVAYDTTLSSEVTTFGRDVGSVRHLATDVKPRLTFRPSALEMFILSGGYQRSSYESNAYTNYHVTTVSPAYQIAFSPTFMGTLSVDAQRYEAEDDSKFRFDSLGPSIGFLSQMNERLSLSAAGGFQEGHESFVEATSADKAWTLSAVYNVALAYQDETDSVNLTAMRRQQPYANGTESLLTTFGLSLNHAINKTLTAKAEGSYQFSDRSKISVDSLDYQIDGKVGLAYKLAKDVDLGGSYRRKAERLVGASSLAIEDVGLLTLTLHPVRRNAD
jgi:hypothetical protein